MERLCHCTTVYTAETSMVVFNNSTGDEASVKCLAHALILVGY